MRINVPRFMGADIQTIYALIKQERRPFVRRSGPHKNEHGVEIHPPEITVLAAEISREPWNKGPDKPKMVTVGGYELLPTGQTRKYKWFYVPVVLKAQADKQNGVYHAPNLDIVS